MKHSIGLVAAAALFAALMVWAGPSVFPTGTTIYDPAKAWNGYTVLSPLGGNAAIVIDMNGNVVDPQAEGRPTSRRCRRGDVECEE